MTYKCNQSGVTITPSPAREIYSRTDRQLLQLGDSVTGSDGSRYLLISLEPISDTLSRLILAPMGVEQC